MGETYYTIATECNYHTPFQESIRPRIREDNREAISNDDYESGRYFKTEKEAETYAQCLQDAVIRRWNEINPYRLRFEDIEVGDFLTTGSDDTFLVSEITPREDDPGNGWLTAETVLRKGKDLGAGDDWEYRSAMPFLREATEEEKQKMFIAANEAGLRWDDGRKCFVEEEWRPEEGMHYFYVAFDHEAFQFVVRDTIYSDCVTDRSNLQNDNCYRMYDDADMVRNEYNKNINQ